MQRTVEQIVDVPVPQVVEEIVQVVQRLSMCQCLRFGRDRQCGEVDECNSAPSSNRGVPIPSILEEIVEVPFSTYYG